MLSDCLTFRGYTIFVNKGGNKLRYSAFLKHSKTGNCASNTLYGIKRMIREDIAKGK